MAAMVGDEWLLDHVRAGWLPRRSRTPVPCGRPSRCSAGVCTRHFSPEAADIERHWHVGRDNAWREAQLFPRSTEPFVRAARDSTVQNAFWEVAYA